MMKQLSDQELDAEVSLFNTLVEMFPEPRRSLVKVMMEKIGGEFFTAPASSRAEYHSSYPGGLLVHSLNVAKNLKRISKALAPDEYSDSTLAFVALFHDLGKVGDGENAYYVRNTSDWHNDKGIFYDINKLCLKMPVSERGLYLLQRFGIEMTSDEYLAIRLSDGQYDESNRSYRNGEPKLALLLHWADMWSMKLEKAELTP